MTRSHRLVILRPKSRPSKSPSRASSHHTITTKKGTQVIPTEHTAKTPSPQAGLFATLSSVLRGQGSPASSLNRRLTSMALAVLCTAVGSLALGGVSAQAAVTHKFEFSITGLS